jgi:hypothetical protein
MERATVQQAEIDRQFTLGSKSYSLQIASSWNTRSTRMHVPMKDRLRDFHDTQRILDNRSQEQEKV